MKAQPVRMRRAREFSPRSAEAHPTRPRAAGFGHLALSRVPAHAAATTPAVSSLRPHTPGLTNTYGTPVGGGAMRACGHAVVRTGRGVRVFRNEGIRLQPSPLITRGPTSADTMLARITWLIGRSCRCPTDARWQAVKASTFLVARARATSRG